MSELKPCPMSTDEATGVLRGLKMMVGTVANEALDIAISALHRAQPANEPLTLEELRGMDGEPVWVADSRSGSSAWMQYAYEEAAYDLIAFWEFGSEVESAYCALDYGKTWLAYRRPPERSENDG